MTPSGIAETHRDQRGAALILALVFMLVISVSIVSLANLTIAGSNNTVVLRAQANLETDAQSVINATIQAVRTSYAYPRQTSDTSYGTDGSFGMAQQCDPPGTLSYTGSSISVYCEGSDYGSGARVVRFFVCKGTSDCTAAAQTPLIEVTAVFDDVPPGDAPSAEACSATQTATCGVSMEITSWNVPLANH